MQKPKIILYWCRRDFRLSDNPALFNSIQEAKKRNLPFLPLFILDDGLLDPKSKWNVGYPRRYFLSKILSHFAFNFDNFSILVGKTKDIFEQLSQKYEIELFANDDIEPYSINRDNEIKSIVSKFNLFTDQMTVNKEVVSGTGNFYSVFTPFKKAVWLEFIKSEIYESVNKFGSKKANEIPASLDISDMTFESIPKLETEEKLQETIFKKIDITWGVVLPNGEEFSLDSIWERPKFKEWHHTESRSLEQFDYYIACGKMSKYKQNRDDLGLDTLDGGQTSRMSVALKWGLVSSRTLKQKILDYFDTDFVNPLSTSNNEGASHYLSELIWREFYRYILYHRPEVLDLEFQPRYQNTIQWADNHTAMHLFKKWMVGETGYPAVDACMHQIAQLGWMHNRGRMMVASILTKNLGVDWRWGQAYFRAMLLDLDEASNNGGWQWASSTGSDPKPIRIFNPNLQAQNHDAKGIYQKTYLPEGYKANLKPLIEHKLAREKALKRYGLAEQKGVRDF
jgi:deoxyribodipyrimidine photo-lyase